MCTRTRKTILSLALIVAVLSTAAPAFAQRGRRVARRGSVVFVGGYFYDPFFGPYPWWSPGLYPYPYFPVYDDTANVRIEVKPRDAAVYVDGYYAGIVDDFDGFFQSLPLSPGDHEVTLFLQGYRTVHQRLYVGPHSSTKLKYTMERLAPGEVSEPPAVAPAVPPPPEGSYIPPRTPPRGPVAGAPVPMPPAPRGGQPPLPPAPAGTVATIVIRVQPADAEITIDGERWTSSDNERLSVEVAPGPHHIEVTKSGYRPLATDVDVRAGTTTPLNVSLSRE